MKFLLSILLIALLSFAAALYMPWWTIAVAAFIVALVFNMSGGKSFLAGFLAIFLLWSVMSFLISSNNGHLLAHKVSLLILSVDNPYYLILATGLIGGLVAGFAALTGSFLRTKQS
ncbi:hypothetical protein [Ferruginibacter sp. HRS2-29]|uniref:hypothetical protein n=1 Tax=Ferruginibacter sp. HRS2-29 TaxID=2487334 RepID=UPI0020CDAC46|nr:hypothetical protein [Ferruginibacter sp. HRS2-29]MCP9750886.1 hypothetical protein [Ferruginibacter sp. HRS2-29]